jgi:catechol 2,3-dioxygenase-like lactoylglutathione lyase family enzyme
VDAPGPPEWRTLAPVIKALHALIYSDDPDATRAFFRDVLGWPYVEDAQVESGWLIFKTGPSELGVHPTSGQAFSHPRQHLVSLM